MKRKENTVEGLAQMLFPEPESLLTMKEFASKMTGLGLTEGQAEDLFLGIDCEHKGKVGLLEFRSVFKSNEQVKREVIADVPMSKEIEQDIKELFEKVDVNKNGFIDQEELKVSLVSIGVNPSPQQLKDFVEQFDLNKDGKIKQEEFSKIVKDYFLREVLQSDELLD